MRTNKICGIYKFTNKTNGKVYIGQSVHILKRKDLHKYSMIKKKANKETYFVRALKKYGWDGFDFEIIERCSKEKLNDREIYWIDFYDACNRSKGYNMTAGGFNNPTNMNAKPIFQIDSKTKKIINQYTSTKEAVEINHFKGASSISSALRGKTKTAYGYIWCFVDKYKDGMFDDLDIAYPQCKYIYKIDANTYKIISKYRSVTIASKENNISKGTIVFCATGRTKTGGGFIWCYEDDYYDGKYDGFVADETKKPVAQINMKTGEILKVFLSVTEAKAEIGGKSASDISQCCKGIRKSAYGYKWKFLEV